MKIFTFVIVVALVSGAPIVASGDDCSDVFTYCGPAPEPAGSFADCTAAPCEWDGASATMTCTCKVATNIGSATAGDCTDGSAETVQSRYPAGVESTGVCTSSSNVWGYCLDVACGPPKDGWTECACPTTTSGDNHASQYVAVGADPDACAPDHQRSSATVAQMFSATGFLRCEGAETGPDPVVLWVVGEGGGE